MATWADIQSWQLSYVEEAEDLIEAEVREAREIIADRRARRERHPISGRGARPDASAAHRDPGQAGLAPQRTHEYALATQSCTGT